MFPIEEFPFSNMHDLNLDWILQEVKKMIASGASTAQAIQALSDWVHSDAMKEFATDQMGKWLNDGTLEGIIHNIITGEHDVRFYGAKGDGVTDDTAAIKAAITATQQGQSIYFASGTYIVSIDTTIPKGITVNFGENASLYLKRQTVLKINGHVKAGRQKLFEIQDDTATIIADEKCVDYEIFPEWFGAVNDGKETTPNGTNNSPFFKLCLIFAQSAANGINPAVIISFAPNAQYFCSGNNPLGIQNDSYCCIKYRGNFARILWDAVSSNYSCFGRMGLNYYPDIRDLYFSQIGAVARTGYFLSSKIGITNKTHAWTKGYFSKLFLQSSNVDTIFLLQPDDTDTMDSDVTVTDCDFEQFKTIINISNSEAVGWRFFNCDMIAFTDNAIYLNIPNYFAGGVSFDSCEIVMGLGANETLIYAGGAGSDAENRFTNCRIEGRSATITILKALSGKFYFDSFSLLNGGGSANTNTKALIIGTKASVYAVDCEFCGDVDIYVNKLNDYPDENALRLDGCNFTDVLPNGTTGETKGFPTINYVDSTTLTHYSRDQMIKNGYYPRKISVINPKYQNGDCILDIEYSNPKVCKLHTAKLFALYNGYPKIPSQSSFSLPPDIVITSIKASVAYTNTTVCNNINVGIYQSDQVAYSNTVINHPLTNGEYKTELLTGGYVIVCACPAYLQVDSLLNSSVVTDVSLIPSMWLEIEYHSISTRADIGSHEKYVMKKLFSEMN